MGLEYPPHPNPTDTRETWERRELRPWRMEQKRRLMLVRGGLCERGCGRVAQDLDEGIIPRSSMMGLSLEKRRLAFASCNLFLLCARCNREEAHQVEWAFEQACNRYGEKTIREWYASIGLKAPRHQFMPRKS